MKCELIFYVTIGRSRSISLIIYVSWHGICKNCLFVKLLCKIIDWLLKTYKQLLHI